MHIIEIEKVELTSYRVKDNVNIQYEKKDIGRGKITTLSIQDDFIEAFLNRFLPLKLSEANVEELVNLDQR